MKLKHLLEADKNGYSLNKNETSRVTRNTANIMKEKYGWYPEQAHYVGIASALNHLFPQLTIVSLIFICYPVIFIMDIEYG